MKLRFRSCLLVILALILSLTIGSLPAGAVIQSATVNMSIVSTMLNALNVVTGAAPLNFQQTFRLSNGTGSGQADVFWSDHRTLAASGTETLDLNGSLSDAFGATVNLTAVKAVLVCGDAANTNNVLVGDAASNAWAAFLGAAGVATVQPGGCMLAMAPNAGYAVAGGTTDQLKIANSSSGTGISYTIIVLGVE